MRPAISVLAVKDEQDRRGMATAVRKLSRIEGITKAEFNHVTSKVTVRYDADMVTLTKIKELIAGYLEGTEIGRSRRR